MKIGIVEYSEDGGLADSFEKQISAELANVSFEKKKALDLFDVLAFARKLSSSCDQLVLIARLSEDKQETSAFFQGLAVLEAETGKPVFKCFFEENGEEEVKELVETFLEYLFGKKKPEKKEENDELPGLE